MKDVLMSDETPDPALVAASQFVFGKTRVRGVYASHDNPQREGIFVEIIRRRGKLNPGIHVRVTNGVCEFWEYPIESVEIVA